MLRAALHLIVRILLRLFSRLDIEGVENIPAHGPAILASNHLALFDAPLVFAVVQRKDLVALVADTYRKNWFIGPIVSIARSIWINRDAPDLHALRLAREHLQRGGLLGIAPEGTRSRTGELIEAKTGVAFLAEKSGAPIIPIAIWGSETSVAQLLHLRRPAIHMRIGLPFVLPPLGRGERNQAMQSNTDIIMLHIRNMLPEAYHGVYRGRSAAVKV